MTKDIERQVIELIATDRIHIPISSMSGKLKRVQPKLAKNLGLSQDESFIGERTYARVEVENADKARRLSEAVDDFCKDYNREGEILRGYIAKTRVESETHVYFGMNEGCRLTEGDYMSVMKSIGLSQSVSERLYPELMEVSYKLSRKRQEGERSILIG